MQIKCPNNCDHYGCLLDKLSLRNEELRNELRLSNDAVNSLRDQLNATQVWLLASMAICLFVTIRSCF